ncbi:MAG: FAD binding domain-containing protein [Rhizobiaceae bacterium]|nr:FAD binding domain-containing protein [Rhizobiaceae bacterium]MCV0405101.1 FAD binding domain-containing protein [Rhizobiaceae bacterium]
MRYARPDTLDKALALLADGPWRVLAGGTDFYPAQGARPILDDVLDIGAIASLRGITSTPDHIVIGARTSWTDVVRTDLPPAFDMLRQAAREVGAIQIQNAGTVAGNLCNASPAADGVPPLLAMDAEIELSSASGIRHLPLADFIVGNRRTARRPNELLTAIRVPRRSTLGGSRFVKLGSRRYLVISVAMAAARIVLNGDHITHAAVAVGACSEVAMRLDALETALRGVAVGEMDPVLADPSLYDCLSPIDDVRGSAAYRRRAVVEIVSRAAHGAVEAAGMKAGAEEAA